MALQVPTDRHMEVVARPTYRALLQLAAGADGLTVGNAVSQLELTSQNARYYARALHREGLVVSDRLRTGRPGQPPRVYRITQAGVTAVAAVSATSTAPPAASTPPASESPLAFGVALVARLDDIAAQALETPDAGLDLLAVLFDQLPVNVPGWSLRITRRSDP